MRIRPSVNEIYHVYNRGTEKRVIFLDSEDYERFIDSMMSFNAPGQSGSWCRDRQRRKDRNTRQEVGLHAPPSRRNQLVEILAYTLMPNHFHLMLRQWAENGISQFMQKVGTGYTNYFNTRYDRSGVLFQGKYKYVHIEHSAHFALLPLYIHANPIGHRRMDTGGKQYASKESIAKQVASLDHYLWSSHRFFSGLEKREGMSAWLLEEWYGGTDQYKKELVMWLKSMRLHEIDTVRIDS